MPPHVRTLAQGQYLGTPRRSFDGPGVHLDESLYAPGVWLPRHRHRATNFCFLLGGGFRETVGARKRECAKRDVLFRPAEEEHEQWFGPQGGRCLNLELSGSFLDRYGDVLHPMRGPIDVESADLFMLGRRLLAELEHPDAMTPLSVEGSVLEILSHCLRSWERRTSRPPGWLLDAHGIVRARFRERLTLSELALQVGVHPVHLARSFRRYFDTSVAACIRQERLMWACRMLSETRRPVLQIALDAGYADQSHLTRAVRLATGLGPAAYRRRFGSARSKTCS